MEFFGSARRAVRAAAAVDVVASARDQYALFPARQAPVNTVGLEDVTGLVGGWYSFDIAMTIPAFARGCNLIAGTIAGMQLKAIDPNTGQQLQPGGLIAQTTIDPNVPNVTTLRLTAQDLIAYGRAYWQTDAPTQPTNARRVPVDSVQYVDGRWTVNGEPAHVIEFSTGAPGALESGFLAIRTALANEQAAQVAADNPAPSLALQSTGVDLDDDDATNLLTGWIAARKRRSVAYLNSQVKIAEFGFNPQQSQLVESRQHDATEMARSLNLDPYWVGAGNGGTTITYSNEQDRRSALLDFTVMPIARVIEQRLSMPDVSGTGRVLRFDTSSFLRANLTERVAAYTAYTAAGILTIDEARALEPLVDIGEAAQ